MNTKDLNQSNIMIIDDTDLDRLIAKKIISKTSPQAVFIEFDMGAEALAYIENHLQKMEDLPQLILLDIFMPTMSGFEFLEIYERKYFGLLPQLKVVMYSSSVAPNDLARAYQYKCVKGYIHKPLTPLELNTLYEIL